MNNIIEDIKSFCEKYNAFLEINKKQEKNMIDYNSDSKFLILVHDWIEKLSVVELNTSYNINEFKHIISKTTVFLSNLIDFMDNLIDNFYIEQSNSMHQKFLEKISQIFFSGWNLSKNISKLPLDIHEPVEKILLNLLNAIKMEIQLIGNAKNISEEDLRVFTINRNGDFFIYFYLIIPFLKNDIITILKEYLENYVILDNILDDIVDAYSDHLNNNFNLCLLYLKNIKPDIKITNYSSLMKTFIQNGIFDDICSLAIKYGEKALLKIKNFNSPFFEYLKFLVEGGMKGIYLCKKYHYFKKYISDENIYDKLLKLVLKPYPFSVLSIDNVHDKLVIK